VPSIIIPASKSLTITDKFPNKNIDNFILSIGNDGSYNYLSYLFFDLSAIPCNASICNAELVLFKMDKFYDDNTNILGIYPLKENFTKHTSYNNYPKIDGTINKCFFPMTSNTIVKIPFTSFVTLWIKNHFINASIMLYGKNKNSLAHFSSAIHTNKCFIPFLRITFTPYCNNKPTLRKVHVTGTVAAQSKYNAVINIGVLRHYSNHLDNYYVADEYDNLRNDTPLHIDKTYNLAIIPSKARGDFENITFYGSYKE